MYYSRCPKCGSRLDDVCHWDIVTDHYCSNDDCNWNINYGYVEGSPCNYYLVENKYRYYDMIEWGTPKEHKKSEEELKLDRLLALKKELNNANVILQNNHLIHMIITGATDGVLSLEDKALKEDLLEAVFRYKTRIESKLLDIEGLD